MEHNYKACLFLITTLTAMSGLSYGQQPPVVVTSDTNFNTAMGSQTLSGLRNGINNTAAGAQALDGNETGNNNTAFGENALYFNGPGNANTATGAQAITTPPPGSMRLLRARLTAATMPSVHSRSTTPTAVTTTPWATLRCISTPPAG